MKKPDITFSDPALLRQKAEAKLKNYTAEASCPLSESDALNLIRELRLRQAELEIQNEELMSAVLSEDEAIRIAQELAVSQEELKLQNEELIAANVIAKDAIDLYDFAPVGYYMLSREGEILRLNLSGAHLLGKDSSKLEKSRFGFFIGDQSRLVFNFFLERVFKNKTKEACEIILSTKGNPPIYVYLTGIISENQEQCLVTATDITEHKLAEDAIGRQNELFAKITQFSVDLSMLPSSDNLEMFVCKRIKELTGALVVTFSEYDAVARVIIPKHIEAESGILKNIIGLLGGQIQKVLTPVDDETYLKITEKIIGKSDDLTYLTFGAVPRPVAAMISAVIKAERYIVIVYLIEGKLYGTSLLAMSKHTPDPSDEVLRNIAFLIAVSLRRKQAEEELQESEHKFKTLFEGANDAILILDKNKCVDCNRKTEILFNCKKTDLVGHTIEEFAPSVLPDGQLTKLKVHSKIAAVLNGEPQFFEGRHLRMDGTFFDSDVSLNKVEIKGNVFIQAILRDITERKQSEQTIIESEIKYRTLIEWLPSSIVVHRNGEIIYVNLAAIKMFGAAQEMELIGSPILERIHPDFHQIVLSRINKADSQFEIAPTIGLNYLKLDGTVIEGEVQGMQITYEGLPAIQVVINDITERKRAEKALNVSESRFRRLYESASLGIFQSTPDGRVISVNPSFAKMFGYTSPHEVENKISNISIELFADPGRRDEIIRLLKINPELNSFENLYRRKDGSTFIGWLNVTRINDHEGQFDHMEGFIEDITERKLAEEALLKSKEQYDKLAANIPVGVYVLHSSTNSSFKLDYASPRMAEMLGLSVENMLRDGSLVYKAIYPEDMAGFVELSEKGIKLKQPFDWTGRISVSGEIKWMHFSSLPELLESGDILWHGLVVDITKEKLAEDEINEAHNRLLKIASRVPGVVYQYKLRPDGTACFPYASEGLKEIYHFSPDEVREDASKVFTYIHPDDSVGLAASIAVSAKELSLWKHEYRVKFPDGTVNWLLGNAVPQREADGAVLWHGFITDITERKLVELALIESESRFKNLFEHHSAIMLLIDPDSGLIIDANNAAAHFYGFSKSVLKSMTIDEINLLSKEQVKMECKKAKNNNLNYFVFQHKLATGEARTVEVHSSPINFQDRQILFSIIHDITERRHAEEALSSSRQILEGIINTIPVRVFWKDKDLKYMGCNSIFLKDAGFTDVNEIIGKDDYLMRWRNQAELYRSDDNEVIRSGKPKLEIEEPQTYAGGENRTLLTSKIPLRNSKGEISGILGTYLDITERKQAEEKLRVSEQRYRQLVETANEAILVAQGNKFNYVNSMACELSGYTEAELLSMPFIEFIHQDDRAHVTENYIKRLKGEPVDQSYSFRFIGKSNNLKWVEMTGVKIDWDGQPATLNFVSDITARKKAEEALIESERHAKALIDAIPDMLFIMDKEGIFIDYSADAAALAYQKDSIIGKRNREIMPPAFADLIDEKIRLTLQNKDIQEFEYQMEIPGRGIVNYEARMVPYGAAEVVAIVRDVTGRKTAEIEISRKTEDLIKVNAEKDKFFSIIAHDLRGPIGGFMGLTEQMAERMADMTLDDLQYIARVMKKSATNLYSLLGNLLEWSRMQRGLTTFEPVVILLMPKIHENIVQVYDAATKKAIEFNTFIPDDLEVFADENMLACIIRNLVANAVKFTPNGGNVSVSATAFNTKLVEVSISDSGIGMNRQFIDNLFNLDINTNRNGTDGELSTGLGLMICKDFIEKHGGELRIESEVGKGSTFRFTIPVVDLK